MAAGAARIAFLLCFCPRAIIHILSITASISVHTSTRKQQEFTVVWVDAGQRRVTEVNKTRLSTVIPTRTFGSQEAQGLFPPLGLNLYSSFSI